MSSNEYLQETLRFEAETVTPSFGEYAFVFKTNVGEHSETDSENTLVNTDPDRKLERTVLV